MDAAVRRLTSRKPIAPTARAKDVQKYTRSRISNHADLLPGVDGNSTEARRFKDLVNAFIADMGGIEMCSTMRIGQARQLAANYVLNDAMAAKIVNGEQIDIATLCTLNNTAVKLSNQLGLERRSRDVTPSLSDILRADQQHQREQHHLDQGETLNGDTS